jgi:hypothetical protein
MEHEAEQAVGQPAVYLSHNISRGATTFSQLLHNLASRESCVSVGNVQALSWR